MNYLDLVNNLEKYMIFSDIENLNIYCEYLFNDSSKFITYSNIMNLYELINYMDDNAFINNEAKMARFQFLKYYLEARIDKGLIKRTLCINYVFDNCPEKYHTIIKREIINSISPDELSDKDVKFINQKVFADLNYIFMHKYKVALMSVLDDVESNKIKDNAEDFLPLFQKMVSELANAKRRAAKSNSFNLTNPVEFRNLITSSFERLRSPASFLKSGYKALNTMLNGGFENGRLYNVIGMTGGFKSGFLLNAMKCIKKYNKNTDRRRSQKRRRTILFISQENNLYETIERIFNIFATTDRISNYDNVEDVISLLEQGGFRVVEDEYDIDIEFRYFPNDDVGVPEIRGIVEELENNGKEVITIIQDYIERLKPPIRNVDRRIQLADISNQLHDLAVDLDIPIITASQINREGAATIEKITLDGGNKKNSIDVGMKDISESYGMLKNIDVNFFIVPQYNASEDKWYLFIKKLKFRGSDNNEISEFYQPFVGNSSKIMLEEDFGSKVSVYRQTLVEGGFQEVIKNKPSMVERKRLVPENHTLDPEQQEIESILGQFKEIEELDKGYTYIRVIPNQKFFKVIQDLEKMEKKRKLRAINAPKKIKISFREPERWGVK